MDENRNGNSGKIRMTAAERLAMQAVGLRALARLGAFRFIDAVTPWFFYTSGQVGPYYVQSVAVEKDGIAYAAVVRSLARLVQARVGNVEVVSGGETRDWDFSNPLAVLLKKPHLKLYKDGRALGADPRGKRVVHVADLNNEGTSVRDYWKPIIEKNGGKLAAVFFFVDRLEDGAALFRAMKLPCHSLVPLDRRAWDLLMQLGHIPADLHRELTGRMRDRRAWAVNRLLSYPGFFRQFYRSASTRAKAEKIIKTYPEIAGKLKEIAASDAH